MVGKAGGLSLHFSYTSPTLLLHCKKSTFGGLTHQKHSHILLCVSDKVPDDFIRVTVTGIDPDLWARFKAQAALERREVRELAADAFALYLQAKQ